MADLDLTCADPKNSYLTLIVMGLPYQLCKTGLLLTESLNYSIIGTCIRPLYTKSEQVGDPPKPPKKYTFSLTFVAPLRFQHFSPKPLGLWSQHYQNWQAVICRSDKHIDTVIMGSVVIHHVDTGSSQDSIILCHHQKSVNITRVLTRPLQPTLNLLINISTLIITSKPTLELWLINTHTQKRN